MSTVSTRAFQIADYEAVFRLWENSDGVELAEGDSRAEIENYLARNPGLSRIAKDGDDLIGAVLCGHDGRRGLVYHLAVAPAARGRGVGRKLVRECFEGLRRAGIARTLILVGTSNESGKAFWIAQGLEPIAGALPMGGDL